MALKIKAFIASFFIYLLPLFDPPGFISVGGYLFNMFSGVYGPRDPLRLAAFLLETAIGQLVAGFVTWWFLKRMSWRRALSLPVPLVLIILASQAFPLSFAVVEPWFNGTEEAEKANLPEECSVRGLLARVRTLPRNPLSGASTAMVLEDGKHSLLQMPGCLLQPIDIPADALSDPPPIVAPNGRALFGTSRASLEWWLAPDLRTATRRLEPPPESHAPILSTDGQWIAWPKHIYGSKPSILIRGIGSAEEIVVPVQMAFPVPLDVLELNMADRTITLMDYAEGFRSLQLDGATRWGPVLPNSTNPAGTFLLGEGIGWLVKHVARADDAWLFPWTPTEPRTDLGLRRGQTLQSVSIDRDGKFLAFSAQEKGRTTVTVMRLKDKEVIFRRYLPAINFPSHAFPGDGFFAYSEPHTVRVLRLPD